MAISIKETFTDGWPTRRTLAIGWRSGSSQDDLLPKKVAFLFRLERSGAHSPSMEVAVFPPGVSIPETPLTESGRPPEKSVFYTLIPPGTQGDPLSLGPYFNPKTPGIYTLCLRVPQRASPHPEIPARQARLEITLRVLDHTGQSDTLPLEDPGFRKCPALAEKIQPPRPTAIEKPRPVSPPPTDEPEPTSQKAAGQEDYSAAVVKQDQRFTTGCVLGVTLLIGLILLALVVMILFGGHVARGLGF